ncbi:MAG TPA: PIN domain nuclease [Balneolaceae bacterium]|nr:PIN domain nuclease [Balneolaceae bacterium]
MSAVDTNVLVRFHVRDDEEQYQQVKNIFASATSADPVFINFVVLIEWVWVLKKFCKVDNKRIAALTLSMLHSTEIEFENDSIVTNALRLFENSSADFVDCLICEVNAHQGKSPTYTFDKKASKLKGMKLLK